MSNAKRFQLSPLLVAVLVTSGLGGCLGPEPGDPVPVPTAEPESFLDPAFIAEGRGTWVVNETVHGWALWGAKVDVPEDQLDRVAVGRMEVDLPDDWGRQDIAIVSLPSVDYVTRLGYLTAGLIAITFIDYDEGDYAYADTLGIPSSDRAVTHGAVMAAWSTKPIHVRASLEWREDKDTLIGWRSGASGPEVPFVFDEKALPSGEDVYLEAPLNQRQLILAARTGDSGEDPAKLQIEFHSDEEPILPTQRDGWRESSDTGINAKSFRLAFGTAQHAVPDLKIRMRYTGPEDDWQGLTITHPVDVHAAALQTYGFHWGGLIGDPRNYPEAVCKREPWKCPFH